MINRKNIDFLKKLAKNNDRDWFKENKNGYQEARENTIAFADKVLFELKKIDKIDNESGKKTLYRIYRDVRFSKDKSPYKTHWAMSFRRSGDELRGGYYVRIKPGEMMVGGGFYAPESKDIKLIRAHIADDPEPLRKILKAKKFKETFGELKGEKVKTAPKGFDKAHPAIELLRYKSMYAFKEFTDKEAMEEGFYKKVITTFKAIRPYFDYMSDILTHDLNGESLLK